MGIQEGLIWWGGGAGSEGGDGGGVAMDYQFLLNFSC